MLSTVLAGTAKSLRNHMLRRCVTSNTLALPNFEPRSLHSTARIAEGLLAKIVLRTAVTVSCSVWLSFHSKSLKLSQGHTIQVFGSYPAPLRGVGIFRKSATLPRPASQSAVRVLGCQSCSRHSVVHMSRRAGYA